MSNIREYQLTLNAEQIRVCAMALDLFSRIGAGQLESIVEHPEIMNRIMDDRADVSDVVEARALFAEAKRLLFGYGPGQATAIRSPEIDDVARVAWDIYQVIRHRESWDKAGNPKERDWSTMVGVNFDEPRQSSEQPLPELCCR